VKVDTVDDLHQP